jgi:hypothetical protein
MKLNWREGKYGSSFTARVLGGLLELRVVWDEAGGRKGYLVQVVGTSSRVLARGFWSYIEAQEAGEKELEKLLAEIFPKEAA